jgi:hypothetical protein
MTKESPSPCVQIPRRRDPRKSTTPPCCDTSSKPDSSFKIKFEKTNNICRPNKMCQFSCLPIMISGRKSTMQLHCYRTKYINITYDEGEPSKTWGTDLAAPPDPPTMPISPSETWPKLNITYGNRAPYIVRQLKSTSWCFIYRFFGRKKRARSYRKLVSSPFQVKHPLELGKSRDWPLWENDKNHHHQLSIKGQSNRRQDPHVTCKLLCAKQQPLPPVKLVASLGRGLLEVLLSVLHALVINKTLSSHNHNQNDRDGSSTGMENQTRAPVCRIRETQQKHRTIWNNTVES